MHSNHRDGQGHMDGNYHRLSHSQPHRFGQVAEQPDCREPPLQITGQTDF